MLFCGMAAALIQGVGLNQIAVWNGGLNGFDHRNRQDIRAVRFAGVPFDGDLAGDVLVDFIIYVNQSLRRDLGCEINFGFFVFIICHYLISFLRLSGFELQDRDFGRS